MGAEATPDAYRLPVMRGILTAVTLAVLASTCGSGAAPVTPAPAPSGDVVKVTQLDDGRTIHVPVGQLVQVALGDQFDWSLEISDPRVLAAEPGVNTLVRGSQLLARAKAPGTATIVGTGKPKCAPNQACIQILATFRLTIVVS